MSAPLGMDPQQIAAQAATIEDLVQQRMEREQRVSDIATNLEGQWKGQAQGAAHQMLSRYLAAAEALRQEEAAIGEKLNQAQKLYTGTDAAAAERLRHDMGI